MAVASFLLLQGVASPFFNRLGNALVQAGHRVQHVNFCGGDALFVRSVNVRNFTGPPDRLPEFLEALLIDRQVTDVLLFGDCRPLHQTAISTTKTFGARIHVFEEGYFRPGWITLEENGVNGYSGLQRDPEWYRRLGPGLPTPPPGRSSRGTLLIRGIYDIAYHWANYFRRRRYPGYRNHRPDPAYAEYLGWARRLMVRPMHFRQSRRVERLYREARLPYFLFPLQLDGDSQIQIHSPYAGMGEAIDHVLTSFAHHAPADRHLVIKRHPLDTGLIDFRSRIQALSARLAVGDRVHFLDGGQLGHVIEVSLGVVTINSTVGMATLGLNRPLKVIGRAVYDVPGLVFDGSLDMFWQRPVPPDPELFADFRKVVIDQTQIRGDYYCRQGIDQAIHGILQRLAPPPKSISSAQGIVR